MSDKCDYCSKSPLVLGKRLYCGRCMERTYCSAECQASDWTHRPNKDSKSHREVCVETPKAKLYACGRELPKRDEALKASFVAHKFAFGLRAELLSSRGKAYGEAKPFKAVHAYFDPKAFAGSINKTSEMKDSPFSWHMTLTQQLVPVTQVSQRPLSEPSLVEIGLVDPEVVTQGTPSQAEEIRRLCLS